MKRALSIALLSLLAASHGVNDFFAGWLLSGGLAGASLGNRLPRLVVYAALAFAGQLPAAWCIDRLGHPGRWLAVALGMIALAAATVPISAGVAVVLSGVASAIVHVAGGALTLNLPRGERAIGWFAAPGVVGLTLGGWLATMLPWPQWWALLPPAGLLAGWLALRRHWPHAGAEEEGSERLTLEAHDGWMLLLLLVLTLRSALWDLVQAFPFEHPHALFALAFAAATGKVFGGFMAARWPGFRPAAVVLVTACAVLEWSKGKLTGICLGVALLQSAIPASIVLLRVRFRATGARASAYGFGVTVAAGGLLLPLRWSNGAVALALAALSLLLVGAGRRSHAVKAASTAGWMPSPHAAPAAPKN